jgi:hypothetical protein
MDTLSCSEGKGHTFESCRVRQYSFAARAAVAPQPNGSIGDSTVDVAGKSDPTAAAELEPRVTDGLYTLGVEMSGAKSGRATGVAVLQDGRIMGGDSFFYYTGSYSHSRGKWRGEMIVHQHAEAPGLNLVFGRREVTCGFTGTYSEGFSDIDGTALVGSNSIPFRARLTLKSPT